MRAPFVCLLSLLGLAGCTERLRPPWLPAPLSDDPEAQEIMGGTDPASPYLLQPYWPRRPWSWPVAAVRASPPTGRARPMFDPKRVSRKLDEGASLPPPAADAGPPADGSTKDLE